MPWPTQRTFLGHFSEAVPPPFSSLRSRSDRRPRPSCVGISWASLLLIALGGPWPTTRGLRVKFFPGLAPRCGNAASRLLASASVRFAFANVPCPQLEKPVATCWCLRRQRTQPPEQSNHPRTQPSEHRSHGEPEPVPSPVANQTSTDGARLSGQERGKSGLDQHGRSTPQRAGAKQVRPRPAWAELQRQTSGNPEANQRQTQRQTSGKPPLRWALIRQVRPRTKARGDISDLEP